MARPKKRQRRIRGTGSVSFRASDGRWEGRWQAPPDGSGQRPFVRVFCGSERECNDQLAAAIADYKAGQQKTDAKQTVHEYLTGWLNGHVRTLKPKTQRNADLHVRYLEPLIGNFQLNRLMRHNVQKAIDTLAYGDPEVEIPARGIRTAVLVHATLRSALNDADERTLKVNPALKVHLPSYRRDVPEPWQLDEAERFLAAIKGTDDEALWLVATYMGPRPYEALAIQWSDLDLDAAELRLEHGIQWPTGEEPYLDTIKSAAGHRRVNLAPTVVAALRRHRARVDNLRAASAVPWVENDLVFVETSAKWPSAPGRPCRPDTMYQRFQRVVAKAGLRRVRLYDLRRLASAVIAATEGLEAAQKTLGQSSIRLAAETYGYQLDDRRKRVAQSVEGVLGRGFRSDTPADTPASTPSSS